VILIEDLTAFILSLILGVISLNVLAFCFVFWRRFARQRQYVAKDSARTRYRPVVEDLWAGRATMEQTTALLQTAASHAERSGIESLLLEAPDAAARLKSSDLLFVFGSVERWARKVFGGRRAMELIGSAVKKEPYTPPDNIVHPPKIFRRLRVFSITRALLVDRLSMLAPEYAFYFCAEALLDPAPEVRAIAVRGLGRAKNPNAFPMLVHELERAVEMKNDISLRAAKTALTEYDLDQLDHFTAYVTHKNSRMRFFIVDIAREICNRAAKEQLLNKNDFSLGFYEVMLTQAVKDEFADVRARSAAVVRHFRDADSTDALRKLLKDETEFVRLHAVRACADKYFGALLPDVLNMLQDTKWRVRESAARTLAQMGTSGISEMYHRFLELQDTYASEQVAEQIQRGGLVHDLLHGLGEGGDARAQAYAVCAKLVRMGKTSLLTSTLESSSIALEVRFLLMDALAMAPTPEFLGILREYADGEAGSLSRKARSILLSKSRSAVSGGALA
jgi:HEAT repeat protein